MAHWLDGALKLLEAETADLTELARMVGADPKTFYRGADFRSADLSDEDISAFDVMGANVSQAVIGERNRAFLASKDLADLLHVLKIERLPGDPEASANWPAYERLRDIVYERLIARAIPNSTLAHRFLLDVTTYLDRIADYKGAAEMALAVRNLIEARLPEADRQVAVALANHGGSLLKLGDLAGALELLERAVALHEVHRPGSADLAGSYFLLGAVLLEQGRTGQAARLNQAARRYQQALALWRRLLGRGDAVAKALNNLGAMREAQGRGAAAARLFAMSLKMWRAVLPPGDARLTTGLQNTGAMWGKTGRMDMAEHLLREALEVRQEAYAGQPQHPDTREAAEGLILCLLRRAAAGENRGLREMEARQLCERYGFEFEGMKVSAMRYPYVPLAG